jgi:hypothetical protein
MHAVLVGCPAVDARGGAVLGWTAAPTQLELATDGCSIAPSMPPALGVAAAAAAAPTAAAALSVASISSFFIHHLQK